MKKERKSKGRKSAEERNTKAEPEKTEAAGGKSKPKSSRTVTMDSTEQSIPYEVLLEDIEEGEEEGTLGYKLSIALSRTSLLILDYRQFKAARVIQKYYRAWFVRSQFLELREATIVIQTWWRRFYAQRLYYKKLEERLQDTIIRHYNHCATIIQALFRGWWVREYIHDHHRLTGKQALAAEDLLHCVAFKLHHLLRTHQIPGIYSLRNSTCLSKVEKLLASLNFKQHNDLVRYARLRRKNEIDAACRKFKKSTYASAIPYAGPNFSSICEPECQKAFRDCDADKQMHNILTMYEQISMGQSRKTQKGRVSEVPSGKALALQPKSSHDFCTDIVDSMRRWKILKANNLDVDPNIFRTPENVENFLGEVQALFEERCHCGVKMEDSGPKCE